MPRPKQVPGTKIGWPSRSHAALAAPQIRALRIKLSQSTVTARQEMPHFCCLGLTIRGREEHGPGGAARSSGQQPRSERQISCIETRAAPCALVMCTSACLHQHVRPTTICTAPPRQCSQGARPAAADHVRTSSYRVLPAVSLFWPGEWPGGGATHCVAAARSRQGRRAARALAVPSRKAVAYPSAQAQQWR